MQAQAQTGGRHARVWWQEDPPWPVVASPVRMQQEVAVPAAAAVRTHPIRASVELRVITGGRVLYAGLGGSFVPANTGKLVTEVHTLHGDAEGMPVADTVMSLFETVRAGLQTEYLPAVLGVLTGPEAVAVLGAGRLTVDRATYDEVGSSLMMFEVVGRILLHVYAARPDALAGALPGMVEASLHVVRYGRPG